LSHVRGRVKVSYIIKNYMTWRLYLKVNCSWNLPNQIAKETNGLWRWVWFPPLPKKKNKRGVRFLLQKIEFKIPIHFGMLFFFFFLRQMCCILNYTIPLKPHPYLKCWKASNQIVTYKCITFLLWYSVP
jgi:hypothetical protein